MVKKANLATLGSLSLQEKILQSLKKQEINVVDMEASAFFSATKYFKLPSLALLYVTDIIASKPFFKDLSSEESKIIRESRQRAISLICQFIKNQNA
jgi:purine-nucleoside phosphorylase